MSSNKADFADACVRKSIAYAATQTSRWVLGPTDEFLKAMEQDDGLAEATRAGIDASQVREFCKELFELLWVAESLSIALEPAMARSSISTGL